MVMKALTRQEFNEQVFNRDGHKCVSCGAPAVDAHHLIERRLFGPSQGYFLDNGVSVCSECHLKAEMTTISVEELRSAAGIETAPKPLDTCWYECILIDKWGNPILSDGTRARGDLFYEEPVQKILRKGGVMSQFTEKTKYPRTMHTPWSPGPTSDDKVLDSMDHFKGREIVVTEKMDGENTTIYTDAIHARSVDSRHHPSRDWVKRLQGERGHEIPRGWRICGENMFALHSLGYDELPSYFLVFSIWDESNNALSWDETVEWCEMLGLTHVPVLYRGIYDEEAIQAVWSPGSKSAYGPKSEGYVIRVADGFHYSDFVNSLAKVVRPDHVQTEDGYWMHQEVVPNGLRTEEQDEHDGNGMEG